MWCVFYCVNGAYYEFKAFINDIDRLLSEKDANHVFYGAFVKEENAKRFVDLINSATF